MGTITYYFTPSQLDFCNWGKIRASYLSVPKKQAQRMGIILGGTRIRPRLSRSRTNRIHDGRYYYRDDKKKTPFVVLAHEENKRRERASTTKNNSYREDYKKTMLVVIVHVSTTDRNYSRPICLYPFLLPPPLFNFSRRTLNDFTPARLDFFNWEIFQLLEKLNCFCIWRLD